jgi:type I site-specific restriction endonuclease
MTDLTIEFLNHVYCKVHTDNDGILQELSEYFTFEVPGAQYSPKFRKYRRKDKKVTGSWDGKIRLFNQRKRIIYTGLRQEIEDWAEESGYEVDSKGWGETAEFDEEIYRLFEQKLRTLSHIESRDYQTKAVWKALDNERCVLLSATGSGKSLIIYYLLQLLPKPALLIVPKVGLVEQMASDFLDYGWKDPIHKIFEGQEKVNDGVVVSTWQSIFEQPPEWFEKFKTVIVDEVHHANASAKSLKDIMEMLPHVRYRIGLTGSLDESQILSTKAIWQT